MAGLNDTHPEAEQVLREAFRRMPFTAKLRQMNALYRTARLLHAVGVRSRNPSATEELIQEEWRNTAAGVGPPGPGDQFRRRGMVPSKENVEVVQEVAAVLTRLGVPYAVGGSWASSVFGKPRLTLHVDITVEPFPGKEGAFFASFGEDYYVSLPMIQDAFRRQSSFNLIHWPSGFKVDLFLRKDRPFDASLLARRHAYALPEGQTLTLVSPEDIILLKLEWYRLGGETSERQLTDVVGVLQVQADKLDWTYLEHWTVNLVVKNLLQRVRQASGI
jgi:hypothetical protein